MGGARRNGWMAESFQQIGVVALPLICMGVSELVGASMFIAAFVALRAVQVGFKEADKHSVEFAEERRQLSNLTVFFLFGLIVVKDWPQFDPRCALYAALSLLWCGCFQWRWRLLVRAGAAPVWSSWDGSGRAAWRSSFWDCLSRAGDASARRSDDSSRDSDGSDQHLRAWTECQAQYRALCTRDCFA